MIRSLSLLSRCRWAAFSLLAVTSHGSRVSAEVVRIEIQSREPFADGHVFGRSGPYERIIGKLHFEVDPADAANQRVTDLKLAPRNDRGKVAFRTDFFLLTPTDPTRGNRRLFYDVNNRGNKLALGAFNDRGGNDPKSLADAGNGFLMRQGYAVLWCGWNGDVRPGGVDRERAGDDHAAGDGDTGVDVEVGPVRGTDRAIRYGQHTRPARESEGRTPFVLGVDRHLTLR